MSKKKKRGPLRVLRRILCLLLIVILLAAAAFFVIPLTETVSVKTAEGSADWMAELDGSLRLNEIVLPGTHDSATQYVQLAFFSKCQALSVGEQLEAGFRYLDIRLGFADTGDLKTRYLKLMHGYTNCRTGPMPWDDTLYLRQVLDQCYAFLRAHPTETVVFAVKYEHGDDPVEKFADWLDDYLQADADMWLLTDRIPTLEEARGKLVLMRRWEDESGSGEQRGIPMLWPKQNGSEDVSKHTELIDNGSYRLWVQDRYEYGAEDKWNAFLAGLREPKIEREDLSIHFLSTKGTLRYGHPYRYAGTLNARLLALPASELRGWIILDFADAELAEHIWSANLSGAFAEK